MKPILFDPPNSPYLVPFDESFKVKKARTSPPEDRPNKDSLKAKLAELTEEMKELQAKLYAQDRYAVLLVFQAMDAAGKDGTIRAVMTGTNPAGCQVYSFKAPSDEDIDHDFFWRIYRALPERGRIGIFNRSHYEEVLIVKVHPEFLERQRLPRGPDKKNFWEERYDSIRDIERHLARNGVVILKFWLNVSQDEQLKRLVDRMEKAESNWKFSNRDMEERESWGDYMKAYEEALNATSRPWAPWYAIPADDKPFMRYQVAKIVVETMRDLNLEYPEPSKEQLAEIKRQIAKINAE